ncbi:MAG: hypothetical protein JSR59_21860 [Proteobacteria bacterium]|nr:hypothetical protein [Pseudomonadota bacterium]
MNQSPIALYLRADGSLLLTKDSSCIEIQLTPRQLLELGTDALRLALALGPELVPEIAEVLGNTHIVPMKDTQCQLN